MTQHQTTSMPPPAARGPDVAEMLFPSKGEYDVDGLASTPAVPVGPGSKASIDAD